jgi:hypothetical protein
MEFSTEGKIWGQNGTAQYIPPIVIIIIFIDVSVFHRRRVDDGQARGWGKEGIWFFSSLSSDSLFLPLSWSRDSAPDFINYRVFSISSITRNEVGFVCVLRLSFPFFETVREFAQGEVYATVRPLALLCNIGYAILEISYFDFF